MQDDLYQISEDGWVALPYRIIEKNKKTGKEVDKGWTCDLIPPELMIEIYFSEEKAALEQMEADKLAIVVQLTELEEEHSGEDQFFADYDKVNKATVSKRLKEIGKGKTAAEEIGVLKQYLKLAEVQAELHANIKAAEVRLLLNAMGKYATLTEADIKKIVVEGKWLKAMTTRITGEMERISQRLTGRIKELVKRYELPLPALEEEIDILEERVNGHLSKMGFAWI